MQNIDKKNSEIQIKMLLRNRAAPPPINASARHGHVIKWIIYIL